MSLLINLMQPWMKVIFLMNKGYFCSSSEPGCGSRERVVRSPVMQAVKSAPQDTCRMALPCRRSTLRGCRYEAWSPWPSWPTIFAPPWTLCRNTQQHLFSSDKIICFLALHFIFCLIFALFCNAFYFYFYIFVSLFWMTVIRTWPSLTQTSVILVKLRYYCSCY